MKKILLIDSHNLIHRARFGFGAGPHKIYFNFFRMLMGELKRHTPDAVYIVDEGKPVSSIMLMPDYKANRKKLQDPDFQREKREIFETIKEMSGFTYIRHPNYECDDVIGFLANHYQNDDVTIVSTDTDFIQLISENIKVWNPRKKEYFEQFPVDYVTWKSLRGDGADNIKGVSGIGDKRAHLLAADSSTLQKFLDSKTERREQFEIAKKLITLKNVDVAGLEIRQSPFDEEKLFLQFSMRKFKTIIGNAWPKWKMNFTAAGGKNDFE